MKFDLTVPSVVKKAKDSKHIIKTDNPVLCLILECLAFFVVFLVTTIIYSTVGEFFIGFTYAAVNHSNGFSVSEISNWAYYTPLGLTTQLLLTLATILCVRIWQKRKADTLGFVKKNMFRDYLIGLGAGFVMFSAAVGLCVMTGALSLSAAPSVHWKLFAVYCIGWFFQGMAEEVLCRGYMLTSVARKNHIVVAVIANSAAFAALHLANNGIGALPLVNLTLFGICASVFFIKTGNIWLVSAMHSIWNMVQGNLYGISVSGSYDGPTILNSTMNTSKTLINGGDFGLEGGLAVTIVLVITIVIGLLIPSSEKGVTKEN